MEWLALARDTGEIDRFVTSSILSLETPSVPRDRRVWRPDGRQLARRGLGVVPVAPGSREVGSRASLKPSEVSTHTRRVHK
jgi:hypothetical protein